MLAIRLQRRGRKGLAQFRVIVQDSHRSPKSGRVVANLGAYDPHTKALTLDSEKAKYYLENGAQPSDRVITLLEKEKITLPKWVKKSTGKKSSVKNPDKLRKNQPKEEPPAVEAEAAPAEPEEGAESSEKEDEPKPSSDQAEARETEKESKAASKKAA